MQPLVSILIPAYNAGQWLAETIQSALDQTWPRKEIIVVDDGSADDTLQVARQFASSDVSVVTQPNAGAAAARNKALELAQGDYIQWLDADDLLSPNKVESQVRAIRDADDGRTLFSAPWVHFIYRLDRAKPRPTPLWSDLTPVEWLLRKWEHNAHMQTATWLVSRELTQLAGPWDTRLLGDDDGEYFFRVVRAARRIVFVPDGTVFYRVTPASRLSHIGVSDRKMEAQFRGMELQIGYLLEMEDSARSRAACVNYLQTWLCHFYPERPDIVARAEELAVSLGGKLSRPQLSWKYAWISKLFGYAAAKKAQVRYNERKSAVLIWCDRTLRFLDKGAVPSLTGATARNAS